MSKTTGTRKRSMWAGPKRRAAGIETLPARPDGAPKPEARGFRNGAEVRP